MNSIFDFRRCHLHAWGTGFDLKPGAIMLIAPGGTISTIQYRTGQAYERYVLWLDPEYLSPTWISRICSLPFQKTYITSALIQ